MGGGGLWSKGHVSRSPERDLRCDVVTFLNGVAVSTRKAVEWWVHTVTSVTVVSSTYAVNEAESEVVCSSCQSIGGSRVCKQIHCASAHFPNAERVLTSPTKPTRQIERMIKRNGSVWYMHAYSASLTIIWFATATQCGSNRVMSCAMVGQQHDSITSCNKW